MPDGSPFRPQISDPNKSADELDNTTLPQLDRNGLPLPLAGQTAEQLHFQQGAVQWIRQIKLTVYAGPGSQGTGLDLSNFRVDFRLTKKTRNDPNFLDLKVYNLHPNTVKTVRQFKKVTLSAGYRSNFGMIFDGNVVLYITGKENAVDTTINIIAGDGDVTGNNAVSILSFPAGTKEDEQIRTALKQAGYTIGAVDTGKGSQPTLRSSHYLGSTHQFIRRLTNATNTDFFVDDGKAYVIPREGYRKGEIVKLSPTTGLTNFPRVTPSGIEAQCLLNPKLQIGGLVQIETSLLSGVPFVPGTSMQENAGAAGEYGAGQSQASPDPNSPLGTPQRQFTPTNKAFGFAAASVSASGIYKILLMTHHGDSRGNPWYTELVCTAAGPNGELLPGANPGTALQRSSAFAAAATPAPAPGVPSIDPGHPAPTRR